MRYGVLVCFFIISLWCSVIYAQGGTTSTATTVGGGTTSTTKTYQSRCQPGEIELNTEIPFVTEPGRPCISKSLDETAQQTNISNAFPRLMASLARILMTVILIGAFIMILVAGLAIAGHGFTSQAGFGYEWGKKKILQILGALALIGISGAILNAVNPNFFKTNSRIECRQYHV